jgi:hypothetical protein
MSLTVFGTERGSVSPAIVRHVSARVQLRTQVVSVPSLLCSTNLEALQV